MRRLALILIALAALLAPSTIAQAPGGSVTTTPTPVVTQAPTKAPAATPAATAAPTVAPTSAATAAPTKVPATTPAPSANPSPIGTSSPSPTPPASSPNPSPVASPSPTASPASPSPAPAGVVPNSSLSVHLLLIGPNAWPFTTDMQQRLLSALAETMNSVVAAGDINVVAATEVTAFSARRLLQAANNKTAADVEVEFNAHSSNNVNAVSTSLQNVIASGSLRDALSTRGVQVTSLSVLSSTAQTPTTSATCQYGALAGICIGDDAADDAATTGSKTLSNTALIIIVVVAAVGGAIIISVLYCCLRKCCAGAPPKPTGTPKEELPPARAQPFWHNPRAAQQQQAAAGGATADVSTAGAGAAVAKGSGSPTKKRTRDKEVTVFQRVAPAAAGAQGAKQGPPRQGPRPTTSLPRVPDDLPVAARAVPDRALLEEVPLATPEGSRRGSAAGGKSEAAAGKVARQQSVTAAQRQAAANRRLASFSAALEASGMDQTVARIRGAQQALQRGQQSDSSSGSVDAAVQYLTTHPTFADKYNLQQGKVTGATNILAMGRLIPPPGTKVLAKFFVDEGAFTHETAFYSQGLSTDYVPDVLDVFSAGQLGDDGAGNPACIVMERGDYTLQDFLKKFKQQHSKRSPSSMGSKALLGNLCEALNYLHARSIVHRNVRPANLMWFSGNRRWRLIDFGFWAHHSIESPLKYSLRYAAPEVLISEAICVTERSKAPAGDVDPSAPPTFPASSASDMWSVGVLAWEVFAGQPLFGPDLSDDEVMKMLLGYKPLPFEEDQSLWILFQDPQAQELVKNLLVRDPASRWSALKALQAIANLHE